MTSAQGYGPDHATPLRFGLHHVQLAGTLSRAGVEVRWDGDFPGHRRFYADDPVGNRLEFIERDPNTVGA